MSGFDIFVFVAFVISVVGIGLWKSKGEETHSEHGAADYFLAGRGLTWWLVGFSLIAANISTEQFVGMTGKSADWLGMAIASYEWMAAITLVIVAFVFLPKFLKCGIYTIPEFLEYRYNSLARYVMAVVTMVILVGVPTASVIYSGAKVISVFFKGTIFMGIDFGNLTVGCWIIGVLAAVYVFVGGLKACAWADLIQGAALIIGGAIIAYFAFDKLGSTPVSELAAVGDVAADKIKGLSDAGAIERLTALNPGKLTMFRPADDPEIPWTALVVGLWIPNFFYWGLNQYIMQRSLGSKSLAEGQKGIVFAAFMKLIIPFVVVVPGLLAFNLFSDDLAELAKGKNKEIIEWFDKCQAGNGDKKVFIFNEAFAQVDGKKAVEIYNYNCKSAGIAPEAVPETTKAIFDLNKKAVSAAKEKGYKTETNLRGYDTDAAFPTLLKLIPKNGVLGFVLAALFGAVVSSLASMLNSAATIFTMDIYNKVKKEASQYELVTVGRISTVVFVLIAIGIAPFLDSFGGIFTFIQEFQGFLSPGILSIFIFGLLVKKAPRMVGTIGIVLNIFLYGALKVFAGDISFLNRMAICLGVIMGVLAVITMLKPLDKPVELPVNDQMCLENSKGALICGIVVIIMTIALYVIFSGLCLG